MNKIGFFVFRHFLQLIVILLLLQGCTANRFLEEGDKFYTGAVVKLKAKDSKTGEYDVAKLIAEEQLSPEPNEVVLGMRPAVWLYMRADTSRKRGVGQWFKNKFGRAPVLYNKEIPDRTKSAIQNKLFNNGFFNAKVHYRVKEQKRSVSIRYRVFPGSRFYMDSVFVFDGGDSLFDDIMKFKANSLIQVGDPYVLDVFKEERERISDGMKDHGFYYFNPSYIDFKVDTTRGKQRMVVGVSVKKTVPQRSKVAFRLAEVNVYPNYELSDDSAANVRNAETIAIDGVNFIDAEGTLDYHFLIESIFLREGDLYTSKNHKMTIRRLSALGLFKFIDVRFVPSDSIENELVANLYLSPFLPQSVRLEVGASSKSNNFVGPGIDVNYSHRNLLKGAEHLTVGIGGAFETQVGQNSQGVNSTEFSLTSKLSVPRLWSPIHFPVADDKELPRTELGAGYRLLNRTLFYRLHNANADFGYRWNQTAQKSHKFTLVGVNYTRASEVSDAFAAFLNENPELERTFNEQLIFSSNYNYRYYSKPPSTKRSYWYVNPGIEIAGNTLNAVSSLLQPESDEQRRVLGIAYSQFSKVDLDVRFYLPLGKDRKLAWRFLGGVGVPYGNSTMLPYLKQYFVGGSNSIRAFQVRSLGPGTYQSAQRGGLFIDQSGDIKLETNLEYRTGIYRFLKGALFVDIGNVWLLHQNEQRPGGEFLVDKFLDQLAVGTGVGLRFDFTYFVLRTDLAFPLRNPVADDNTWLIDQISFSKRWRRDNLVLNIAIGYPF